jgi:DNA-binding CsgD family transcriptional regulator
MSTVPEILRLRDEGLTQKAIAERLGCSRSWVSKTLIGNGRGAGTVAGVRQAAQERQARAVALRAAGRSPQRIAADLEVTLSVVYGYLRAAGAARAVAGCGTWAGCQAHRKRGEKPCEPCRLARNAYVADWRRRTGNYPTRRPTPAVVPVGGTIRGAAAVAAARAVQRHVPAAERAELLLMLGLVEPARLTHGSAA